MNFLKSLLDSIKSLTTTHFLIGTTILLLSIIIIPIAYFSFSSSEKTITQQPTQKETIVNGRKTDVLEDIQNIKQETRQRKTQTEKYSINNTDTTFIASIENDPDKQPTKKISIDSTKTPITQTTSNPKKTITQNIQNTQIKRQNANPQKKTKKTTTKKKEPKANDIILFSSLKDNNSAKNQKQPSRATSNTTPNASKRKETIILKAAIYNTQTVRNGDRVKVITKEDYFSKTTNKKISAGKIIYTIATIGNGRVLLSFTKLTFDDGSFIHTNLNAYDILDDRLGIYAEELLEQQATKEVIDEDVLDGTTTTGKVGNTINNFLKKSSKQVKTELRDNTEFIIR